MIYVWLIPWGIIQVTSLSSLHKLIHRLRTNTVWMRTTDDIYASVGFIYCELSVALVIFSLIHLITHAHYDRDYDGESWCLGRNLNECPVHSDLVVEGCWWWRWLVWYRWNWWLVISLSRTKMVIKLPFTSWKFTNWPHFYRCAKLTLMYGSFENEALENEDRSTKHPNLENEAPKPRKRSTLDRKRSTQTRKQRPLNLENEAPKTRKRSTQNSKTKHPNLENEAPKTRKRSTLDRKRSTQNSKTKHLN